MPPLVLDPPQWRARSAAHQARVDGWLAAHRERRRAGVKHPVFDFLFTYYTYRPAQLRRWHPGLGVVLAGATDAAMFGRDYHAVEGGGVALATAISDRRLESVRWIRDLLLATAGRPAHFGCLGLHEWAMVYRQDRDALRHSAWPLRLGAAGTAALVEANTVRCTHFDAFRFFTPAARPRNLVQPSRDSQLDLEQPGCLHANMDVYRWAYKLAPLTSAELVADCFALAREIRTLDMRAGPYDLSALGLAPLEIETASGRAEYVAQQRAFATAAAGLRVQLIDLAGATLDTVAAVRAG